MPRPLVIIALIVALTLSGCAKGDLSLLRSVGGYCIKNPGRC